MKNKKNKTSKQIFEELEKGLQEKQNCAEELKLVNDLRRELDSEKKGLLNLALIIAFVIAGLFVFGVLSDLPSSESSTDFSRNRARYDSIYMKVFETENKDSFDLYYRNHELLTYPHLYVMQDSLSQRISVLEDELYQLRFESDLIKRQYPIRVRHENNKYWAESPKIDSALILLLVYRDKLFFSEEDGHWYIK